MTRTQRAIRHVEGLWWSHYRDRWNAAHQSEFTKLMADSHNVVLTSPESEEDWALIRAVYGERYLTGSVATFWVDFHHQMLDREGE